MTAEQDGLNPAAVMRKHEHRHWCEGEWWSCGRCPTFRLAALALNLQGKVARVNDLSADWYEALYAEQDGMSEFRSSEWGRCLNSNYEDLLDALADPTPAARCLQQTPFVALSEPTCTRSEGHVGAHLFTSYDGKTPLEMMPK